MRINDDDDDDDDENIGLLITEYTAVSLCQYCYAARLK